ncbi:MAG: hypothetical protein ACI849_000737, partial [Patiriisocius sp.]
KMSLVVSSLVMFCAKACKHKHNDNVTSKFFLLNSITVFLKGAQN